MVEEQYYETLICNFVRKLDHLAVLSACGVEQTPATATDAPAPFSEAPETEEFATTIPVVGEDYTLSSVEISGAYTYISHGPIMKCLDEQAMNQARTTPRTRSRTANL